jgi:hypothetical protein
MAKGWDAVEQQAKATQEARERAEATFLPELRVGAKNPGPFYGRFLEQGVDVNNYPVHDYKVPLPGGGVGHRRFTCLTEVHMPCPGCAAGMKQKRRGVYNFIQRNRPVYRKGPDGKAIKDGAGQYITDGYEDAVVVVNVGGPTAEMLRKADADYRGLMCRDFQVTFSGDTFQSWDLKPIMDAAGNSGPTPMSENDQVLAAKKHDLDAYMKPPSLEEAQRIVNMYGGNSGASPVASAPTPPQGNAGQAGQASGFLAGANVPTGVGTAFGAAQQ